jgi:hypothetical protein
MATRNTSPFLFSRYSMLASMKSPLLSLSLAALLLIAGTSCQTYKTRKVLFKNHPVALYVISELIDEETLEYSVKFRNVGRDVLSFDYTIADEGGVPHIDSEGPNSGVVENLYPGAEVKVENPTESMTVYVTLGKVTYGKRPQDELKTLYSPAALTPTETLGMPVDGGLIPLPAGPNPPVGG